MARKGYTMMKSLLPSVFNSVFPHMFLPFLLSSRFSLRPTVNRTSSHARCLMQEFEVTTQKKHGSPLRGWTAQC